MIYSRDQKTNIEYIHKEIQIKSALVLSVTFLRHKTFPWGINPCPAE